MCCFWRASPRCCYLPIPKEEWDRTHKPVHPKGQEDELVIGHGIVIHGLHHKDGVGGVDLHHSHGHGHGHDGKTFKRH